MSKALGKQRRRLWHIDPHCHWCGAITRLVEGTGRNRGYIPDDAATVDHLYDRWDPRRTFPTPGERRHVIACRKCNNTRVSEHMTIDALRSRSRAYPMGAAVLKLADAVYRALKHGMRIEITE